jgi:hypothetical protein
MLKIIVAGALVLVLSGCAHLSAIGSVTSATVTPTEISVAGNAFVAAESLATAYNNQAKCSATNKPPFCRDPAITKKLIPLIAAGNGELNALIAYSTANAGAAAPVSMLNVLEATIASIQAAVPAK